MSYKRKFTYESLILFLGSGSKTSYEIAKHLGCTSVNVFYMTNHLIEKKIIGKISKGNPNKPLYEFYLLDPNHIVESISASKEKVESKPKSQLEIKSVKSRTFSGLAFSIKNM